MPLFLLPFPSELYSLARAYTHMYLVPSPGGWLLPSSALSFRASSMAWPWYLLPLVSATSSLSQVVVLGLLLPSLTVQARGYAWSASPAGLRLVKFFGGSFRASVCFLFQPLALGVLLLHLLPTGGATLSVRLLASHGLGVVFRACSLALAGGPATTARSGPVEGCSLFCSHVTCSLLERSAFEVWRTNSLFS